MKRLFILAMAVLLAPAFVFADAEFSEYEASIKAFAEGVASSLPLNSSVGLTWSDAYIGQFPRFGVGATVGFTTIPYSALEPVVEALGLTEGVQSNEELYGYLERFGGPLPAYTLEARLGGFMVPFDVGVKFGTIPQSVDTSGLVDGFEFDYLLAGIDARVNLLRGRGLAPKLSVGAGYNYLDARVGLVSERNIEIASFEDPLEPGSSYDLTLENPTVEYFWRANVVDFTVQASKDILLFTPYLGAGASIGFGSAGGGLRGALTAPGISDDDWAAINEALEAQGKDTLPKLGPQGVEVIADMPAGWAFRAYGGVSLNLIILRLDLTGMYDFLGKNYGATVGVRIQF